MKVVCLFLLSVGVALTSAWKRQYEGYQHLGVSITNREQAKLIHGLEVKHNVDVSGSPSDMTIMVSPQTAPVVKAALRKHGIDFVIKVHDVQEIVDREYLRLSRKPRAYDKNDFNTFEDCMNKLKDMETNCPSTLSCKTKNLGQTHEGRDITSFQVSAGSLGTKPVVFLEATLHAREWLAAATNMRIAEHFVDEYGTDAKVTYLLDNYEFHILPVANPDGYKYSFLSGHRYWRKNRSPQGGCTGVDLNRNWDYKWGKEGVSHNPCSDIYCGPSGHSEKEMQHIGDEIKHIQANQKVWAFVDFHSYGHMWMHPWGNTVNHQGWTCERATDHADMYKAAQAAAYAIRNVSGKLWDYGTSCEVIYATSGGSDDWNKGVAGVKYGFNPELRGNGFVIDKSQIQDSFEEVFAAVDAMVREIEKTPPF